MWRAGSFEILVIRAARVIRIFRRRIGGRWLLHSIISNISKPYGWRSDRVVLDRDFDFFGYLKPETSGLSGISRDGEPVLYQINYLFSRSTPVLQSFSGQLKL